MLGNLQDNAATPFLCRRGWGTSWLTSTRWTGWCSSHGNGGNTLVRRTSWGTKRSWRAWVKEAASANKTLRWEEKECPNLIYQWLKVMVPWWLILVLSPAGETAVPHSSHSQHTVLGRVHHFRAGEVSTVAHIFYEFIVMPQGRGHFLPCNKLVKWYGLHQFTRKYFCRWKPISAL